jgi:signal transduction histidine kinase
MRDRARDPVAVRTPLVLHDRWRSAVGWPRRSAMEWWDVAVLVTGAAAAAVAVAVTLRADFLAYPGWLAVQKADLILGPIAVGVYWRRQRPQSRFGPMLIVLGFLHVPYLFQSSSNSILYTVGGYWAEIVIYLATLAVILAFPNGLLSWRRDGVILAAASVFAVVPAVLLTLFTGTVFVAGSIAACAACPPLAGELSVRPSVLDWLVDVGRGGIIAVAIAISAVLVVRFVKATPPQRRALAIGTPIALLFLLTQASYQLTTALGASDNGPNTYVRWLFVIARSALWYGFLLALVVSALVAARVLRQMVGESLRRPSLVELEALLRRPLGDPRLQLAFRKRGHSAWTDGDGRTVEPPTPGSGRTLTEVYYEGRPAAGIVHDVQLADDPELLHAAGATALLAYENAELQAAWSQSLRDLRGSRARLATASARERRSLERDLHDGAQQALVALGIKLSVVADQADDPALHRELNELGDDLDRAIDELRDLAHGIYPSLLSDLGLVYSLKSVAQHAGRKVDVSGDGVGRYPAEIESALYYCCREALQNAVRHAGPSAQVSIRLHDDGRELCFEVRDDGRGFDVDGGSAGAGLRNMEDRLASLDGRLDVTSAPGGGTVISGAVPLPAV